MTHFSIGQPNSYFSSVGVSANFRPDLGLCNSHTLAEAVQSNATVYITLVPESALHLTPEFEQILILHEPSM